MPPVAADAQRARQFSLKLQELDLNEAMLTSSAQVSKLPFPSINRSLPERMFAVDASDLYRRTFDFMGREKLADVVSELNRLSVGGRRIWKARKQKQASEAVVTEQTFRQMTIYGSPG